MGRVGVADLPLHGGSTPRWLFRRMVSLSHGIVGAVVEEKGQVGLLQRLSDPFWFQALSCVIGFDWHSSGTTTVTCGALKEAMKYGDMGVSVAGGKGSMSRMAPQEIVLTGRGFGLADREIDRLVYASRMSAKVDNSAVLDGHDLYHHVMFVTEGGKWAVVQQGMSPRTRFARRYHWLYDGFDNFVVEPHASILGERVENVLDMTASSSAEVQEGSVALVSEDIHLLKKHLNSAFIDNQSTLDDWAGAKVTRMFLPSRFDWNTARRLYDFQPRGYEELLSMRGVGPSTVRALALIAELVYGTRASWRDPVKYTFAVGGKDGVPYPVDRATMDETIEIMEKGVMGAKVGNKERLGALRRLRKVIPQELRYRRSSYNDSGKTY